MRVRGREGEEVRFSRAAARRAGTLTDWIEDTGGDGAFSAPPVSTAALRLIAAALKEEEEEEEEPGGGGAALEACPLAVLAEVITGATFLAADAAVALASRELDRRLEGKGVGELREMLGAAADLSETEAAEPVFVPPGTRAEDSPCSLSSLSEDALEGALREVDAATLVKLKGVSAAWRACALRVGMLRFSCTSASQVLDSKLQSRVRATDRQGTCTHTGQQQHVSSVIGE